MLWVQEELLFISLFFHRKSELCAVYKQHNKLMAHGTARSTAMKSPNSPCGDSVRPNNSVNI